MRIYISVPISGLDLATQQILAAQTAEKIRTLGHEPVNPFDTPEAPPQMDERERYAYYMGEDIKRLLTCDGVFFCEGWYNSSGCRVESYIAETYHIKHYHDLRFIPKAE